MQMLGLSKTPEIHKGHEPKAKTFGLSEDEAKWIRVRVERDMSRTF
jgi:hypothetical protein